jgi:NAD(P)-dependent dehydrogenase (short-subunit alcohol dehydrogenase family)
MSEQRRVVVTGASKGIGRATMRRLRTDGYHPIGVARTKPDDLEPGEDFLLCDLSDLDATADLAAQLAGQEPCWCLVNNAAMSPVTSLDDVTLAEMETASRVSLLSPLLLTQQLVPGMRAAGGGRIVNISSRAALGKVNRTAYTAAKAALAGVTRTWAPGPIDTEIFRVSSPPGHPRTEALMAAVPLQRVGQPEEVANLIAFLLQDLSGYITGQNIHIDGGLTISAVKP